MSQDLKVVDLERGENVLDAKTIIKNKRGSCPVPFPCPCPLGLPFLPCLPCILPLLIPIIIFGLAILAFIGYIIFVYGFNNGCWNPNDTSCDNVQLVANSLKHAARVYMDTDAISKN